MSLVKCHRISLSKSTIFIDMIFILNMLFSISLRKAKSYYLSPFQLLYLFIKMLLFTLPIKKNSVSSFYKLY